MTTWPAGMTACTCDDKAAWPFCGCPDPTDEGCCPSREAAAANLCGCRGSGARTSHNTDNQENP